MRLRDFTEPFFISHHYGTTNTQMETEVQRWQEAEAEDGKS